MDILDKIKDMTYFSRSDLMALYYDKNHLNVYISRLIKNKSIVKLKRGIYTTNEYLESHRNNDSYIEFIANHLIAPSYLSESYILKKYNVFTEHTYGIVSITLKTTQSISNDLNTFTYRNITPTLFRDIRVYQKDGFYISYAPLYKALFDYFYFRQNKFPDSLDYIDSLRFNWENITTKDLDKLYAICVKLKLEKMKKISQLLITFKEKYGN
ncbi:MAG: type IV toxin-antitoxin system AbiEi family antitoxin domain-containing protein [Patescibacteria group bacterium]